MSGRSATGASLLSGRIYAPSLTDVMVTEP
jgi:hypothetical protein